jgi:chemotaxis protein methyltransferase WspC
VFAYRPASDLAPGQVKGLAAPESRVTNAAVPDLQPTASAGQPVATGDSPAAPAELPDPAASSAPQASADAAPRAAASVEDDLRMQQISRLADLGHVTEAREACAALISHRPDNVQAHFLMGVLELASGHLQEAEGEFRRAIYLAPRHEGALSHLALLRARRGDAREAEQFRRRAALARSRG